MRTEDLITSLAADRTPSQRPTGQKAAVLALAVAFAVLTFAIVLGVRPDIASALASWQFPAKLAVTVSILIAAIYAARNTLDPLTRRVVNKTSVGLVLAVVAAAFAIEIASFPADTWMNRLIGIDGIACLASIPLLALAPLAAIVWIMRDGAPGSPTIAGAAAGIAAGALAATIYANHCPNDSPFYIMVWYATGIMIVGAAGALAGRRWLAW